MKVRDFILIIECIIFDRIIGAGARFSKATETFRERKAIFSESLSQQRKVNIPETSVYIKNMTNKKAL